MTNFYLKTPNDSVRNISTLLKESSVESNQHSLEVLLEVKEADCFGDEWLNLGEISLKPLSCDDIEDAVRFGFYEWKMPEYDKLYSDCKKITGINSDKSDKLRRSLQTIIDVAMRMGFLFPKFDADIFASMPFNRPTTIVADTNAVAKGGVDFLIKFLSPMARLKIPAIVAMEILNLTDRFFNAKRSKKNEIKADQKIALLYEHVVSQAMQRAMLRFELHSDIEIERTALFSDPLRNAFINEKGGDFPSLNLSAPHRSYCDRLILETARQHQSRVSSNHQVLLMTADEGLARMALAEGIQPLFFHSSYPREIYGKVLTGNRFRPFDSELFHIPLQYLLWELAVTFGYSRLVSKAQDKYIEACALANDLNWQPFHSKDDLLRVSCKGIKPYPTENNVQYANASELIDNKAPRTQSKPALKSKQPPAFGRLNPKTIYRFTLNTLLNFISTIIKKQNIPITCEGTPLQSMVERTKQQYIRFLRSGAFVSGEEAIIRPTDNLYKLWDALMARNLDAVYSYFCEIPSLKTFFNTLETNQSISAKSQEKMLWTSGYIQIAEVCCRAIEIPGEAIYGTFNKPPLQIFIDNAINIFERNRQGEEYILAGLWLEMLAKEYGIHPLNARDRLAEAQAQGLVKRYTQGSTPDTRFENHTMTVLEVEKGHPVTKKIYLYHGDFIIPGKSSVSIRIERATNGS